MAKIGRNEKCPCGSGRKYKHCCSRNPQVQERLATAEEQMKISLTPWEDGAAVVLGERKPF